MILQILAPIIFLSWRCVATLKQTIPSDDQLFVNLLWWGGETEENPCIGAIVIYIQKNSIEATGQQDSQEYLLETLEPIEWLGFSYCYNTSTNPDKPKEYFDYKKNPLYTSLSQRPVKYNEATKDFLFIYYLIAEEVTAENSKKSQLVIPPTKFLDSNSDYSFQPLKSFESIGKFVFHFDRHQQKVSFHKVQTTNRGLFHKGSALNKHNFDALKPTIGWNRFVEIFNLAQTGKSGKERSKALLIQLTSEIERENSMDPRFPPNDNRRENSGDQNREEGSGGGSSMKFIWIFLGVIGVLVLIGVVIKIVSTKKRKKISTGESKKRV